MTRRKVKLAFISSNSARKASYNKRKRGIIKKVRELTVLCDVPGCIIISNPFNPDETAVFPDREGAMQVIERYRNTAMKDESKNVNQQSFLLQRITKGREKLERLRHDNHEKETGIRMLDCIQNNKLPDNLSIPDLHDLDKIVEKNLKEIENKLVQLNLSN
ncbi:agamous-like mads-box protein agl80-like [Trifolium pratense]|uniref:Uncharacterized protein n=2 Tax=Trifolium pratense TaxID=57577 RepID=A0ACB0KCP2_TRIPR|nr:agamous-like mads-box protein agl80-like [Trifolium pratense]CAJ2655114.1 unnamed protein product [Trifolium pratense]